MSIHFLFSFIWIGQDLESVMMLFDTLSESQNVTFCETTLDGRTPLHLTIAEGRGSLLNYLLTKTNAAGINVQNSLGVTPIILALQLHLVPVVHSLIDHRVDLFIQTHLGENTLSLAKELNNEEVFQ